MPLFDTGNPRGSSLPSLAFASAVARAEDNSGTTAFTFTLNLTRNGVTSAIPYSWAVIGSGAQPADASDFVGGVLPSGSGTFGSGETSKTISVNVAGDSTAEPDESFTLTASATLGLAAASAGGTIINDDAAPPPALLMGSRFNQMGFNGYTGSDGTDTDSNSRISSFNETGATVTKLRAYFTNWFANATNEQNGYNNITITAALEYPSGTFTPILFGGATSKVIAASDLTTESDELTGLSIAAGAQFWIRTYVSVPAGQKWVQGYQISTTLGEAADFTTGVDKTQGGTITNATASSTRRGYGPVAVKATGFSGTPVAKAFAAVGDSIIMGSTDGNKDSHGNTGYFPRACGGLYPVINLGIAGTAAQFNLAANFTRRGDLLGKIGVTHLFCDWAVNDLKGGRSAAQVQADVQSIAGSFKAAASGVKVVWASCTPQTTSSDSWKTTANQTLQATPAGAFTGGAASQRSLYNAALRAGFTNVDYVFDAADAVETARDSGIWRAAEGSTHLTNTGASTDAATTDGLHPSVTNTTGAGSGGVYILRDAAIAALAGWS
jgi:hypothetical protein